MIERNRLTDLRVLESDVKSTDKNNNAVKPVELIFQVNFEAQSYKLDN